MVDFEESEYAYYCAYSRGSDQLVVKMRMDCQEKNPPKVAGCPPCKVVVTASTFRREYFLPMKIFLSEVQKIRYSMRLSYGLGNFRREPGAHALLMA